MLLAQMTGISRCSSCRSIRRRGSTSLRGRNRSGKTVRVVGIAPIVYHRHRPKAHMPNPLSQLQATSILSRAMVTQRKLSLLSDFSVQHHQLRKHNSILRCLWSCIAGSARPQAGLRFHNRDYPRRGTLHKRGAPPHEEPLATRWRRPALDPPFECLRSLCCAIGR